MFVKKKVYICDYCGDAALPRTELLYGVPLDCMPKDWIALGKEHLCPTCAEVYRRVSEEVKREREKEEHNI